MSGRSYPSFFTSLVSVAAGALVSAWLVVQFDALAPSLGSQAWSIAACAVAALAVKAALRPFGYDVPFFAAGGALLAQRVVSYALAGATASSLGPFPLVLPAGLLPALPGLLLGAMVVQFTAARRFVTTR